MELDDRSAESDGAQRLFRVLWRRKWWIFLVFDLFVLAGLYQASREEDRFTAAVKVRLPSASGGVFDPSDGSEAAIERELRTQEELVTSPQVQALVDQDLADVPGQITSVDANGVAGTSFLEIEVQATTPELAAAAADSYAENYTTVQVATSVAQIEDRIDQIQVTATDQRNQASALDAQIAPLVGQLADAQSRIDFLRDKRNTGTAGLSDEENQELADQSRTSANLQYQISVLTSQKSYFEGQAQTFDAQITQFRAEAEFRRVNAAQVISGAPIPGAPDETSSKATVLAFMVLGLLVGVATALAREYLDESVHDVDQLEFDHERYPVLGTIANAEEGRRIGRRRDPTLVSVGERWSTVAESYRALRTNIEFAGLDRPVQTLLITSASPGEGKSTTLANLAAVLSAAGSRVVVVCCDLRRPNIHRFYGKTNDVGLTSVLLGTHSLDDALQTVELPGGYTMQLLASGPLPPNPSEVLGASRAGDVFAALRERADYVLLDPPPVVPVTDAVVTSRWADAIVCVARMGVTRRRAFHQMLTTLERTGVPILGMVLTGTGTQRTTKREGYVYRSQRDQTGGLWKRIVGRADGETDLADWDSLSRPIGESGGKRPPQVSVPGQPAGGTPQAPGPQLPAPPAAPGSSRSRH